MKKLLLMLLAVMLVGACISSCSKKDEPIKLNVSPREASMIASQTIKLNVSGASGAVSYESKNPLIASVSEAGEVRANLKGKTDITISSGGQKVTCSIDVRARINFIDEPILDFGDTKQSMKAKIASRGGSVVEDNNDFISIMKEQDESKFLYIYSFEGSRLSACSIMLSLSSKSIKSFTEFILERYFVVSQSGTDSFNLISPNKDIIVAIRYHKGYTVATFIPFKDNN